MKTSIRVCPPLFGFTLLAAAIALFASGCGQDGEQPPAKPIKESDEVKDAGADVDVVKPQTARNYPDMPEALTSFGAVLVDNTVYTFGGHKGGGFTAENQSVAFRRLSLAKDGAWEELGPVQHLESTSLVTHNGLVYRIGGLIAENAAGEPENLVSVKTVERYDPSTGIWQAMPDMPEGRSGHGAVVVGDKLYAVGGWQLTGAGEFLTGGFVIDLSIPDAKWTAMPEPPFKLRSMGVTALNETIYVLGGVGEGQDFSSLVYKFDTKMGVWSPGPELPSEIPVKGFGATACSDGQDVYVNYTDGLYRLRQTKDGWEPAGKLAFTRYFSPVVCPGDAEVIILGGRAASTNEFTASVESVDVTP